MDAFSPGQILGERFAVVGVLGSGGTATVLLVVDQLRGEQVALKVVHRHLAADATTQRRLRREVGTSSLVNHEAAVVPHDVHSFGGRLALSLPYHKGQTLEEYVGSRGPMSPGEVRQLGIRLASALAAAHRVGVLHRDVTPRNILLSTVSDAAITDFGLARVEGQQTRATAALGTAGFAAPEVYGGERTDPRSDLYGLGCCLYLAATGKAPFAGGAMASLQAQLDGRFTPVREANPAVPGPLAGLIERLLEPEPSARLSGAGAVVDVLSGGTAVDAPVGTGATTHIEPGSFAVVVREVGEDRARRRELRVKARTERKTLETEISRRARELMQGVLHYVGLVEPDDPTPEEALVLAVAHEAGVEGLRQPAAIVQKRFVLVDGISEDAAGRIAEGARNAGFLALTGDTAEPPLGSNFVPRLTFGFWLLALVAFMSLPGSVGYPVMGLCSLMLFASIVFRPMRRPMQIEGLPLAFRADLSPELERPQPGRFVVEAEADAPVVVVPVTVVGRARAQLDSLRGALDTVELPDIVRSDLRDTVRDLVERVDALEDELTGIDAELAQPLETADWMAPRLDRLRTKQRAGEAVEVSEIQQLERSLAALDEAESARSLVEARRTACTSELLEIAATATRVRSNLRSTPQPGTSAKESLQKLERDAEHAQRARREMAARLRER